LNLNPVVKKSEGVTPKRTLPVKLIVACFLLGMVVFIAMNLPRGYSDDLSPIGKGKPALVLIRDKNAVQSFDLLNAMDGVRDQNAGKVEFLLTDFDTRQGQAFSAANHASRATLVLLDEKGNFVKVLSAPQSVASLQSEITALFGGK
jgi:hypothetical protein